MSRKRRMFDIEAPSVETLPTGKVSEPKTKRRGPMAAAISETAGKAQERAEAEQAIREENDRLAFELVRLRKEGLVVAQIDLSKIRTDKLIRDRVMERDEEIDELKDSIREIGLSNPIRVEPGAGDTFELVQGMRRWTAFKELFAETGDEAYAQIPAVVQDGDASTEDSYRRMVDENLIRKDLSFAEMGKLAWAYTEDDNNDCDDVDKAVKLLFKSASYTKRSYIRAFAGLLKELPRHLQHPNVIPRNLGVDLKRRIDAEPMVAYQLRNALKDKAPRSAEQEMAILRGFVQSEEADDKTLPVGKVSPTKSQARKPRTTFEVGQGARLARCAASTGRLELRCDVDFSTIDRRKLEGAVQAFLEALEPE